MKFLVTCPPMLGMIDHFQLLFEQHGMGMTAPKVVQTMDVELLPMDSYLRQQPRCIFGSHNVANTADALVRTSKIGVGKLVDSLNISLARKNPIGQSIMARLFCLPRSRTTRCDAQLIP
jgi:hypothetical protein